MLTIIVGKTGSGKSLFAMHLLIRELRSSTRQVVTTLAVNLDKLKEYCDKKWSVVDIDVHNRVRVIEKEELRTFWRERGMIVADRSPRRLGKFGDQSWTATEQVPVLYILDEAQTAFNAREWAKTSVELTDYITQHRKLSDDIVAIAPACALLDKQFRILAHECVVLENLYQKRFRGFTPPRQIRWNAYQNAPPVVGEEPISSGKIFIEPEKLAACYDTASGLGIVGSSGADKGKRSKGIPWWALLLAIPIAGGLMWLFSRTLVHSGQKLAYNALAVRVEKGTSAAGEAIRGHASVVAPVSKALSLPELPGEKLLRSNVISAAQTNISRIVGAVKGVEGWVLLFDDGEEVTTEAYDGRAYVDEAGFRHTWQISRRPVGGPGNVSLPTGRSRLEGKM